MERESKSFLKKVSAFVNYSTGKMIFGISDELKIKGIYDSVETCFVIENMIHDNIKPIPYFLLEINKDNTITLTIKEGLDKPYLYNNKAYSRSDSATIEGSNQSYEEMMAKEQNFTFEYLKKIDRKIKN